jgi:hypothetical protein
MTHRNFLTLSTAAVALMAAAIAPAGAGNAQSYQAHLRALNAGKIGSSAEGDATFKVVGNNLEVHIRMKGVPANIEHWEHFHGFPDGKNATCVTPDLDKNKDGYLDLGETAPVSGTTMVPFNDKPEEMIIPTHTYPHASAEGAFEYTKVVPLKQLEETFGRVYDGHSIDLDKRVIYVHGIPSDSATPGTVGSLGTVPSHVTLPIACGKIEKIRD